MTEVALTSIPFQLQPRPRFLFSLPSSSPRPSHAS